MFVVLGPLLISAAGLFPIMEGPGALHVPGPFLWTGISVVARKKVGCIHSSADKGCIVVSAWPCSSDCACDRIECP